MMQPNNLAQSIDIALAGAKGGGTPRKAVESPDTLKSIANARIIDAISEGEIEGFVHGNDPENFLRDVYYNETPVQNENGTRNFKNVTVEARMGTQDQTYIPGFPAVENEIGVGVALTQVTPWIRSFTNLQLSAINVRLGVSALSSTNTENGDISGYRIQYAIDIAVDGGAYVQVMTSAFGGKASGPYERSHRVDLPPASESGWLMRVRRITGDSTSIYVADETSVVSITEIIDGKFRYPMTALVSTQIDASQFQAIPTRAFHMKGRRIKVPVNYDPETGIYSGVWNGTFKTAYSNNPAWVFYDLATNPRYGLGHLVQEVQIDKWSLYGIAQYCDQIVPDGFGGTERRMTCNLYLQKQGDAFKVLGDLASVFRGICYWMGGAIVSVADRPTDPVYTYNNSNVVGGTFRYEGSGLKARHSAVIVSWNDMSDFCRLKNDYYEDPESLERYGFQLTDIVAVGCTSRGQAQRLAKWLLYSERLLTNAVSFSVGEDGTFAAPGQIVRVADKHRAGRRIGGRVVSATLSTVTLDAWATPGPVMGDSFTIILPTGVSQTRIISSVNPGTKTVTVNVPFSGIPLPQSVWAVDSNDLSTQLFRVLNVVENDDGSYGISALQHNPSIFDAVDMGEPIEVPNVGGIVAPPTQVRPDSVVITSVERAGRVVALPLLTAKWPATENAQSYRVQWRKDFGEWTTVQEVNGLSADYDSPFTGTYECKVSAVNVLGIVSAPTQSNPFVLADQVKVPGYAEDLIAEQTALYNALAQEAVERFNADAAVAAAAAADASAKADAALATALAAVDEAVGAVVPWDNTTDYTEGQLVTDGGLLYLALQDVPAGTALSDGAYWDLVGEYSSLGAAVAASITIGEANTEELSAQASQIDAVQTALGGKASADALNALTSEVTDLEGVVTAQGEALTGTRAALTGGGNLLKNPSYEVDTTSWAHSATSLTYWPTGLTRDNAGAAYIPPGMHNIGVTSANVVVPVTDYIDLYQTEVPVIGGKRYCVSGYVAVHRGSCYIIAQFTDAAGTVLTTTASGSSIHNNDSTMGGTDLNNWDRATIFATAPAGARYLKFYFRTVGSGVAAYTASWLVHPMVEEVSLSQTLPSPWNDSVAGMPTKTSANASAIGLLTSRVSTAEGNITAQGTAITATQASLNGRPNMLQNPTFAINTASWTLAPTAARSYEARYGSYLYMTQVPGGGNATEQAVDNVNPGTYTFSGEVYRNNNVGTVRIGIVCLNAGGGNLGEFNAFSDSAVVASWQSVKVTFTAPAGTTKLNVRLITEATTNTHSFRRLKLELGNVATVWSNEQDISGNASATQVLSATVSSQGGQIASNASAITNVTARTPGSGNLLRNTDFAAGLVGWTAFDWNGWGVTPVLNSAGDSWRPTGMNNIGVSVGGTPSADVHSVIRSPFVPIEPGKTYIASAYLANHRCWGKINIQFADANQVGITAAASTYSQSQGGTSLAGWTRATVSMVAPANARYAYIQWWASPPYADNPYAWMLRAMIEEANSAGQTVPGPWGASATDKTDSSVTQSLQAGLNAKLGVYLDVNGYISGYESVNNGTVSAFNVNASFFRVLKPGGGARTEFSDGNWRVYDGNGTLRVRLGIW
jgi:predicted phage tail protein